MPCCLTDDPAALPARAEPDPARAPAPTGTPVGSAERVDAYRRRVAAGFAVFHPGDSRTRVALTKGSRDERSLRRTRTAKDPGVPVGVSRILGRKKCYRVRASAGGRQIPLGYYLTLAEAGEALRRFRAGDDRILAS